MHRIMLSRNPSEPRRIRRSPTVAHDPLRQTRWDSLSASGFRVVDFPVALNAPPRVTLWAAARSTGPARPPPGAPPMYTTDIRTARQLDALTPGQVKSYEIKLRRAAARQGLVLHKHRARDPYHLLYGTYQLVDASTNDIVWATDHEQGYGLDLSEVAQCLWTR